MGKVLARTAAVLIGVEFIYLVLVNVFLNSPIGPALVNHQPEKLQLQWHGAWSVVPGLVNTGSVTLRGQTRRVQWYAEADRTRFWVRFWKLPFKHFEASDIEAESLSFKLRNRLPAGATAGPSPFTPDIPGLSDLPEDAADNLSSLRDGGWHVLLEDLVVQNFKQIWVQQYRVEGNGRAIVRRYSAAARGGPSTLSGATLEFSNASLQLGDKSLARNLLIRAEPVLNPVTIRGSTFAEVAQHISGPVSISGQFSDLNALNTLFQGMPIHVGNASDVDLNAHLIFQNGVLAPDSKLVVHAGDLQADYLNYRVRGRGALRGEISRKTEGTQTTLKLVLDEFTLSDKDTKPYVRDRGFEMIATVQNLGLANSGENLKIIATLPESFVPNIGYYNRYIPAALGLQIQQGTGRMESQFEVSRTDGNVSGEIKLSIGDFVARYESFTVSGHVDIHTIVNRGDLETNQYNAAGTRLHFTDVTFAENGTNVATNWHGKITLGKTELNFDAPLSIRGDIRIEMSNAIPLLALFEETRQLVQLVQPDLGMEGLQADSALILSNQVLQMGDFKLNSDKLTVLGELIVSKTDREGILYVRHGHLALAVENRNSERHVQIIHAREWFDEKREAFRARHGGHSTR